MTYLSRIYFIIIIIFNFIISLMFPLASSFRNVAVAIVNVT